MKKDLLKYTVKQEDIGIKIDSILKNHMNLSRRMITGLKKNSSIFLNGEEAFTNIKVNVNDEVSVNIVKDESQDIEPQDIPIEVVFEDNDLLILNKLPGIVVHPTKNYLDGTLSNGIIKHWREKGESTIVRLVNRLDRDTSGLIIIAKNQFSHQAMAKQMDVDNVEKKYYAIVHGDLEKDEGTIDLPIDRPTYQSIRRDVMESGIKAVTHYFVVERFHDATLVEIRLETGKTHQIRVHMTHIGHPLFGDTLYGDSDDMHFINRQALHAYMLKFNHPRSGEHMKLCADLPEDMKILIERLRNKPVD